MAYNPYNFYPGNYNSLNPYQQYYYNQQMMQQAQTAQAQQQPQSTQVNQPAIQQSGFVLVQSEQEARAYPVAPGNSITFKDESQPYCYVKTMGFNQLDRPIFERYRLVKEELSSESAEKHENDYNKYAFKSDLKVLCSEIEVIKEKIRELSDKKPTKKKIIEVEDEDNDE